MRNTIFKHIQPAAILFFLLVLSCTKNDKINTEGKNGTNNTNVERKIKPTEINFLSEEIKNVNPAITKAKLPQLIYEDTHLFKSFGNKTHINKASLYSFTIKNLPTKVAKPIIVTAKQPLVTIALPYRTRENNPCNFKYLDVEQGLKNAIICSVVEDHMGAIWFASKLGLTKYDGKNFFHYNQNQGLIFNNVKTLAIDHNNNIWIGTYGGGLSKFDGNFFTNYNLDSGLPSNTISSIFEDSKHTIWIGTLGGGACSIKDSLITYYNNITEFDQNITSINEDKFGNIIFGSADNGFYLLKNNVATNYNIKDGLVDKSILTTFVDNKGTIWLGGDGNGVSKFDGENFINFSTENGLPDNTISTISQDLYNNLWFGTVKGGIIKYDGANFHNYSTEQGLNGNSIQSLICSKNGIVWIGTEGSGIAKYSGDIFTHRTVNEGLTSNWIWNISQTKNNNFWFATNNGGVNCFNGKQVKAYTTKEGLNQDVVISELVNKDGSLWFGTYENGFCHFDNNEFKTFTTKTGLIDNTIWTIIKDQHGNVWFGTENGLAKFDGKNITNYTQFDSISNVAVFSSLLDRDNILWFGTNGNGLLQFKNGKFYKITKEQGLVDDVISCILQDEKGNLWFGSQSGGVSRLKDGVFTNLNESNGLSNSSVLAMVNDKEGNIWFGTRAGINKLSHEKISLAKIYLESSKNLFTTYGINEGFTGNNCVRNSVYLDNEYKIWWGTTKMLTTYNPNSDKKDLVAPKIEINSLKLFFEDVDWNKLISKEVNDSSVIKHSGIKLTGTTAWNNLPVNLVLPYNQNHISFNFIGINFKSQEKIKYQYILEGFEEEWNPITSATEAVYSNLPNGKFTFKIKAVNKDGIWSEPCVYTFEINPPWWKTWWFRTFAVLSIIFIIYFYIKYRESILKQRQVELEQTVDERTKEVVNQKEIVEKKQTEILDSINYAKRIQHSLLASDKLLNSYLRKNKIEQHTSSDYFVVFKPKDIVSGDFYWATKLNNHNFAILTADSTGHGVPGAIMSMLNIACLKEAIVQGITSPDLLLNETRRLVIENLKNDGSAEGGKDGMDGSLLSFDFKNNILYCASANNPIWIIRSVSSSLSVRAESRTENGHELIEIKPDRMPIGKHDKDKIPFTIHTVNLQKGDVVYTLTDGFPDQFGGANGKKFKSKQLQELILSIAHEPMQTQKQKLNDTFDTWRGNLEQVDDVCIIGVRV